MKGIKKEILKVLESLPAGKYTTAGSITDAINRREKKGAFLPRRNSRLTQQVMEWLAASQRIKEVGEPPIEIQKIRIQGNIPSIVEYLNGDWIPIKISPRGNRVAWRIHF